MTSRTSTSRPFGRPFVPPGTAPFSWAYWRALHGGFKASGWRSQERWQLAYLHSASTLEELAQEVLKGFAAISRPATVSVQSVWIDGTPQVTGFLSDGRALAQCELADLLFIVNQMDPAGIVLRRTGLLVQGKTAKRHNALPSNHSTKKERLLLEGLNRTKPLSVYRDVKLMSPIGTYTFGSGTGLRDCARYLMMAKTVKWECPICAPLAPLQIGWPKSRATSAIDPTTGFVEAMQQLATTGGMGRLVQDKGPSLTCEWSRLVWDLLGDYEPIEMNGYGGQNRVNVSPTMAFFAQQRSVFGSPPMDVPQVLEAFERPPAISVVQVNIRAPGTDQT